MKHRTSSPHVAIVGAGVGGLASAMRLAHAGMAVTVVDRLDAPGGKMRTVASEAGPVDAGPTVLTMKHVFEALFSETGNPIENYVALRPEPILARHFWLDGTMLDLSQNHEQSVANVASVFGEKARNEFINFARNSQTLFETFDTSIMQAQSPRIAAILKSLVRNPSAIWAMAPHRTLASQLRKTFSTPHLAQLFGRYATYVGGSPYASPALLSLIASAEAQGVWYVEGGMHNLALAMAKRATELGAVFKYNSHVERIEIQDGRPCAIHTETGRIAADFVLFNGDPRALAQGQLGAGLKHAVAKRAVSPRSLSAAVHAFSATPEGLDLVGHNVFFGKDPTHEFGPLERQKMPEDPTLYVCAQDRFGGQNPPAVERFEIIMNAPPSEDGAASDPKEIDKCQTQTFARLRDFGLRFTPVPKPEAVTMPQSFAQMFPASNGSLYGRSPHGMTAAFQRPTVRSNFPGLYLVGGGVHPGAGIPMVTLCAQHAAEAIISDLALTLKSPKVGTHGGTSTGSAMTGSAQFR